MTLALAKEQRRPFSPSRPDGRADKRVIYDMAERAAPDTTFTYTDLRMALSEGLGALVPVQRVYPAVAGANKMLLRNRGRYLGVVRGTGYRVLHGKEHLSVAEHRESKARRQFRAGMEVLAGTLDDELTPAERRFRDGTVMVMGAVVTALDAHAKKLALHDKLIDDLVRRMDERDENDLDPPAGVAPKPR